MTTTLGPSSAVDPRATTPAYRIETTRLVLRPYDVADTVALTSLISDNHDHLAPFMPWASPPPTLDQQLAVVRRFRSNFDDDRDYVYGLFTPEGRVIGAAGIHPRVGPGGVEIGYWIDAKHEGRGLMSEAVAALVQVAFATFEIDRVEVRVAPLNCRSSAIPKRLGFAHESTLARRISGANGELYDAEVWVLYAGDPRAAALTAVTVRAWDGAQRRLV